ncbi:hypothetical protein HY994_06100 [Candidatus Micrarchaeota archaeon]|nr:hypothetical protein [Candidatus Micrarchaeota archaeon]
MNERNVALREFVTKHGLDATPKTLAENGDSTAKKLMALVQKSLKLGELVKLSLQK